MVRVRWHSIRASVVLPPGRSLRARRCIIIASPDISPPGHGHRRPRLTLLPLDGTCDVEIDRASHHSVRTREGIPSRLVEAVPTTAAADAAARTTTTTTTDAAREGDRFLPEWTTTAAADAAARTTTTTTTDAAREGDRPVLLEWTTPPARR